MERRKNRMYAKMNEKAINLIVYTLLLIGLAGCISPGQERSAPLAAPAVGVERIKTIDDEIAKEQQHISEHRTFINGSYIDLWQVQRGGPTSSRGGISQNKPVDVKHEIIRIQGDIAAAEKDITNRNRRIESLIQEKSKIEDQETKACFPAETRLLTGDGRLETIQQIKIGDMVMTFDIGAQVNTPKPVLNTFKNSNNHYYLINHAVKATAFERFLTPAGWKQVLLLKKGDQIFTRKGLETIDSLIVKKEPLEVYNLQVADSHTFYVVGEDEMAYLVHNSSGGGK